jgi:hypothetical protein
MNKKRGSGVTNKEDTPYQGLARKSGGSFRSRQSVIGPDDLEVFRALHGWEQTRLIRTLKHRKVMLERDWYAPGLTLIAVGVTAFTLATSSVVPYALQRRTEALELIEKVKFSGIDTAALEPNAWLNENIATLVVTGLIVFIIAALLMSWSYVRSARSACTTIWLEAFESERAGAAIRDKSKRRSRLRNAFLPRRERERTT